MRRIAIWVGVAALLSACGGTVNSSTSRIGDDAGATGGGSGSGGAATSTGGRMDETGGKWPGAVAGSGGIRVGYGGLPTGGSIGYGGGYPAGGAIGYGGASPATGGAIGIDGGSCTMTREFAHVEISGAGFVPDSGDSESGDVTLSGRVTVVTATEMEVDSCPAFADCDAMVTKLLVTASGLELGAAIPVGALVSLHYRKMCAVTCTTDLVVTSLDGWGGYTNAVRAPSGIYLAVDEGGAYEAMPEFPFTVERVRLDCPSNFPSGGCPVLSPGLYALRFYERSGGSVLVSMGETSFYGLAGSLSVRNLRSYSTGECDLYYDWAFWIAGEWAD